MSLGKLKPHHNSLALQRAILWSMAAIWLLEQVSLFQPRGVAYG
jgi:hypothetical protein